MPQHARFADLCVLSQDGPATDTGYTFSEQLLFVTGRPVVFVPVHGSFDTLGLHILVAWNSSRASTRAVNDALPLIERAEQVTVLAVNPAEFAERYGALPPEQMVEHLRRHGASVEGIWLNDIPPGSIVDAVQAEAPKFHDFQVGIRPPYGHCSCRRLLGQLDAYNLTHWAGRGSSVRAMHSKGRRLDTALQLVCVSLRGRLPVCVTLAFPLSTVCRDLACTLASARGAGAPLQTPRAAYFWAPHYTIRRPCSLDALPPPDGPHQPNIDVPDLQ